MLVSSQQNRNKFQHLPYCSYHALHDTELPLLREFMETKCGANIHDTSPSQVLRVTLCDHPKRLKIPVMTTPESMTNIPSPTINDAFVADIAGQHGGASTDPQDRLFRAHGIDDLACSVFAVIPQPACLHQDTLPRSSCCFVRAHSSACLILSCGPRHTITARPLSRLQPSTMLSSFRLAVSHTHINAFFPVFPVLSLLHLTCVALQAAQLSQALSCVPRPRHA